MAPATDQTAQQLLEVTMLVMRRISTEMRRETQGVSPPHVGIMARLSAGTCSMSELAVHQGVRPPTMSRSVAMLVDRGWVERWTPEDNRRQTLVGLTGEGRRVLAQIKRKAERHVAGILEPLDDESRTQIGAAMGLLKEVLQPGEENMEQARRSRP
jgi:DNA-binding MarR family transcriptional regulator